MCTFQVMNLNDNAYPFAKEQFDVIFCRNVLIYFTSEDQNKILKKLFTHLKWVELYIWDILRILMI